jgi:hypothetical protein
MLRARPATKGAQAAPPRDLVVWRIEREDLMRAMKPALMLLAALALGLVSAGGASAFQPSFLTSSGRTLSFTSTSGLTLLRGLNVGVLGTVDCEKGAGSGEILNKSTLARKIELEYSAKCELTIGATKTACTEPIKFKLTLGELGLVTVTNHKVVLLLAPESGSEFVKITCGADVTTVEGTLVGEFPEVNKSSANQYNKSLTSLELVFKSENKTENQAIREIWLLGTQVTSAELKVSGFLGGKASVESTQTISPDGGVSICTE